MATDDHTSRKNLLLIQWHLIVVAGVAAASLLILFLIGPIRQDPDYHNFADKREFFGIPNFFDVASNLGFLFAGVAGLIACLKNSVGRMRLAWAVLFAGVTLVTFGSGYYHLSPNDETLVWDRLPMTVGFMGLFAGMIGEYINRRLGQRILIPAILFGAFSVAYWYWSGDLRTYVWVQAFPLIVVPILLLLHRSKYSHQWLLLVALGFYGFAKVTELYDADIFEMSGNIVSGHTIKHLLSAAGCFFIAEMLRRRQVAL